MTQQIINIGAAPYDGTGDQLRPAFDKANDNFTELYAKGNTEGLWNYNKTDTNTGTAPVSGRFKTNSGNYRDATQIAIHATTIQGIDRANTLRTLLVGDIIQCQDSLNSAAWCRYVLQSSAVDNGTWFQLSVAFEADGGVASGDNQEIIFTFTANVSGAGGNVSAVGTPTNGQLAQWTDATHIQGVASSSLGFASLASPIFTGDPQAPTPLTADNDTSIATTAFVKAQSYATIASLASYAPLASPALTGNPIAPTAAVGTSTTQIATTAFVDAESVAKAGDTMTGALMLSGDPTAALQAAPKQYVDAKAVEPPQGRLTLQTGVPVMTTTQAAKTTVYYTPYNSNLIPIYDGSSFSMTAFSEISVATTDTSKNPAAIGASKVNDWFIWNDAGTIRISHGPDWTNDTTRSAGTALVMINGIWLNNVSITNGPAASRGTYVGTTRSNASSQLDWIFGALAATGTAGFFGMWNAYNRVDVGSMTCDSTDSWVLSTVAWRPANNSTNMRCSIVRGLDEDAVSAQYTCAFSSSATNSSVGIGLDITAGFTGITGSVLAGTSMYTTNVATYNGYPGLGLHFLQATEFVASTSGATFIGDGNTIFIQNGLSTQFRA
jgi:hypothetical protein